MGGHKQRGGGGQSIGYVIVARRPCEVAKRLVDRRFAYLHSWGRGDMPAWDNWRVVH